MIDIRCPISDGCNIANRCAARTEQRDDLGRVEQNAGDEHDIYQPPREIVELAAEDQHAADDRDGRERDEAGDGTSDRLLDLLKQALPRQIAAAGRCECGSSAKSASTRPAALTILMRLRGMARLLPDIGLGLVLAGREALDMQHVVDLAAAIRSFDSDDHIDRLADDFAYRL